jgi:hypothetical protein
VAAGRFANRRQAVQQALSRVVVNLAAWQIATFLAVVGVGLLLWSEDLTGHDPPTAVEATIREAGALLLVTGTLALLWELRGRRALTREVLAAADLSDEIIRSGLTRVTERYLQDVEWNTLIASAQEIDLFFSYAQTWRHTHEPALRAFVARPGTTLRVVLPDRTDTVVLEALARKYNYRPGKIDGRIEDAESDLIALKTEAHASSSVTVKRLNDVPVFAYYRFDGSCVVTMYSQIHERGGVPTFVCGRTGSFYKYFQRQFEGVLASAVAL